MRFILDTPAKQTLWLDLMPLLEEEEQEYESETQEESYKRKTVRKELTNYFNEEVKSFPGLKDFKDEIVNSRSFIEASKKIDRIKEKKQEQVKFSEAKLETSWIPKGRI